MNVLSHAKNRESNKWAYKECKFKKSNFMDQLLKNHFYTNS